MNTIFQKHFMAMQQLTNKKERGFIVLISTLVVGAVAVAITASVILFGLSSSRTSFSLVNKIQSYWAGNGCIEEVLENVREDTGFAGSGHYAIGQGFCDYTIINTGGETREIRSEGVVNDTYTRIKVIVSDINPEILIGSWQEVDAF